MTAKVRVATLWLDGCSGCHMSLLDMDDALLDLVAHIDLVYSPLVDAKTFPDDVDLALVEGAVGNEDDLERIRLVRDRSKYLIALGDCAVTGNIPSMRNRYPLREVLRTAYDGHPPDTQVPKLLEKVVPLHEVVPVDLYIPGCPPPTHIIRFVLEELLAGRQPDLTGLARFG